MASHNNFSHHPRRRPEGSQRRVSRSPHGKKIQTRKLANKRSRARRIGLIPAAILATRHLGNKLMQSPLVPILGGLLALGFIIYALIWIVNNKNAYDIYVGEDYVTSIARNKDISEKWIFDNALAKLSSDMGSTIQVDRDVTIVPANRPRNALSTVDYAINNVYIALKDSPFRLEAADIMVNNVIIATLINEAEAKSVLDSVMLSYAPVGAVVVDKNWVDDIVTIIPRFAEYSEIDSPERAFTALTLKTEAQIMHRVQRGESIWRICHRLGITQDRLIELNPGIPEIQSGNIREGQMIKVVTLKPLASVRTVEEITYTDVEKRTIEERHNDNRSRGYRHVLQEGRDGTREVTVHVVRINGVETGERSEIMSKTLIAPVVEIVEVGTQ